MRFLERVSPEHADDLGLQMLQAGHPTLELSFVYLEGCTAPCMGLQAVPRVQCFPAGAKHSEHVQVM